MSMRTSVVAVSAASISARVLEVSRLVDEEQRPAPAAADVVAASPMIVGFSGLSSRM